LDSTGGITETTGSSNLQDLPDKIIPAPDTGTITPQQETATIMEVHHHPDLHHKKKKWKEYLLEFLMIFLAVTMGFFAESFREHLADKEKEKQNIGTIVTSIASDTMQLNNILASNRLSLMYLKKFMKLKGADLNQNKTKKEFYEDIANGSYNDVYFRSNDAAFQQLQTSGTLRLINKQEILDSLFQYQHYITLILRIEADHYYFSKLVWEGMSKLIDVGYTANSFDTVNFNFDVVAGVYRVPEGAELYFDSDKKTVNKLFNDATVLTLNADVYIGALNQQLIYGRKLIRLLKNEYQIE
jgi:hypothetical protein